MFKPTLVYAGGPCTCRPGRYIRFVIPRGVPGCEAVISCRANDAANDFRAEHPLPIGAEYVLRVPSLDGKE
jgi:hypothetical protein